MTAEFEEMQPHLCWGYDAEADALTIYTAHNYFGTAKTITAPGEGILVDTVDGKVVSIEILDASRRHPFSAMIPRVEGANLRSVDSYCHPNDPPLD